MVLWTRKGNAIIRCWSDREGYLAKTMNEQIDVSADSSGSKSCENLSSRLFSIHKPSLERLQGHIPLSPNHLESSPLEFEGRLEMYVDAKHLDACKTSCCFHVKICNDIHAKLGKSVKLLNTFI